jgi:phenylacetate-coenzyme A ligase PaaK-like adenylate-forming protein
VTDLSLRERLLSVIRSGRALEDAEFNALALDVFRHQFECNAPYRAFCERRGVHPDALDDWLRIPAVPTDAFKAAPLVCGAANEAVAVFETSGTTAGAERRGRHYFPELALYDAALAESFAAHMLPDGARLPMLALVLPAAEAPNSSLSHMIERVMREFGAEGSDYFLGTEGLDAERLLAALERAEASWEPVCLLGTSFAFVHLLDELEARGRQLRLASGSRLMDTGGFKGRSREVRREELYAALEAALGVPVAWCVNEYGMTEMSSQFYDTLAGAPEGSAVEARLHAGPPWLRTRAVDPETMEPLPQGAVGILRHWDLANLNSVLALQTADLGVVEPGGIRVLGRARGAEARGCSLAVEELLRAMGRGV